MIEHRKQTWAQIGLTAILFFITVSFLALAWSLDSTLGLITIGGVIIAVLIWQLRQAVFISENPNWIKKSNLHIKLMLWLLLVSMVYSISTILFFDESELLAGLLALHLLVGLPLLTHQWLKRLTPDSSRLIRLLLDSLLFILVSVIFLLVSNSEEVIDIEWAFIDWRLWIGDFYTAAIFHAVFGGSIRIVLGLTWFFADGVFDHIRSNLAEDTIKRRRYRRWGILIWLLIIGVAGSLLSVFFNASVAGSAVISLHIIVGYPLLSLWVLNKIASRWNRWLKLFIETGSYLLLGFALSLLLNMVFSNRSAITITGGFELWEFDLRSALIAAIVVGIASRIILTVVWIIQPQMYKAILKWFKSRKWYLKLIGWIIIDALVCMPFLLSGSPWRDILLVIIILQWVFIVPWLLARLVGLWAAPFPQTIQYVIVSLLYLLLSAIATRLYGWLEVTYYPELFLNFGILFAVLQIVRVLFFMKYPENTITSLNQWYNQISFRTLLLYLLIGIGVISASLLISVRFDLAIRAVATVVILAAQPLVIGTVLKRRFPNSSRLELLTIEAFVFLLVSLGLIYSGDLWLSSFEGHIFAYLLIGGFIRLVLFLLWMPKSIQWLEQNKSWLSIFVVIIVITISTTLVIRFFVRAAGGSLAGAAGGHLAGAAGCKGRGAACGTGGGGDHTSPTSVYVSEINVLVDTYSISDDLLVANLRYTVVHQEENTAQLEIRAENRGLLLREVNIDIDSILEEELDIAVEYTDDLDLVVEVIEVPNGSFFQAKGARGLDRNTYLNTETVFWSQDFTWYPDIMFSYVPPGWRFLAPVLHTFYSISSIGQGVMFFISLLATFAISSIVQPLFGDWAKDRVSSYVRQKGTKANKQTR